MGASGGGNSAMLARFFTPRKLIFHFFFWGFHWAIFGIGWWKQQGDIRLAPLNALQFSVWISRGAGLVLSVDTMVIVMPMCRNILRWLRPKARWAPLDENQWFHKQVAYAMLFFTILHTGAHYVK
ncbi:hypothetical protein HBH97_227520 [Parastagonospora nodorum]|nr:hypothetical protein HBH97_227520 [Parastagonospora nodorum]